MVKSSLAIPKKGIVASKVVKADSTNTDISEEIKEAIQLGKDCVGELRKIFPEIPENAKYRRSKSWSTYWYITFYLEIPVVSNAKRYATEKSEGEYNPDFYWEYIYDFENTCSEITDKFSNDEFHFHVSRVNDTHYGNWDQATLEVYIVK